MGRKSSQFLKGIPMHDSRLGESRLTPAIPIPATQNHDWSGTLNKYPRHVHFSTGEPLLVLPQPSDAPGPWWDNFVSLNSHQGWIHANSISIHSKS